MFGNLLRKSALTALLGGAAILLAPTASYASYVSNFGVIDAIDFAFAPGGGVFNGAISGGVDDAWLVFGANAGDVVTIDISTTAFKNAVLLQDTTNGVFAVGDALNLTNFNISHVGEGDDLTVLSHIGDLEFSSTANLVWNAAFTGQYGIAIGAANNSSQFVGPFTVTISGNTGSVAVGAVPLPATLPLLAAGLGLLGFARAKRGRARSNRA